MSLSRHRGRVVGAVTLLLGTVGASATGWGASETMNALASHRGVYEMSLGKRLEAADVVAVEGRLVYEFSGSKCEGWTSRFRLVTRVSVGMASDGEKTEGVSRLTDLRTSAYEDGEGKTFDFLNQNLVDGREAEHSKGLARHEGDKTTVRLDQPTSKTLTLPAGIKFPTEHLAAIIDAAKAGKTVTEIDLYDGSETGEKVYRTTVVIGNEQTGEDDTASEPAAAVDLLKGKRRWPVDVSYFDPSKVAGGEATPDYQMSFLLYENGVSRKMKLDYGEFSLKGTLSKLETIAVSACP